MLCNKLTTLGEADGSIEKRQERRRDKWARSRIWVTSRIDSGCALPQPLDHCLVESDRGELRKLTSAVCRVRDTEEGGVCDHSVGLEE